MKRVFYILIIIFILHLNLMISENISAENVQSENLLGITEENFPDQVLREILNTNDKNSDGYLSDEEIRTIKTVTLDKDELSQEETAKGLNTSMTKEEKRKRYYEINLKGIDKLTSLQAISLNCCSSKKIKPKIYHFKLLYKMPKIIGLQLSIRNIKKLKLYKFSNLKNCTITSSQIDSINFGKNSKIEYLYLDACNIKRRLDISQLKKLKTFIVENCVITDLKMGDKNKKLEKFYLDADLEHSRKCTIRKLDFTNMKNLKTVGIWSWEKLKEIRFKNNNKLKRINIVYCPKLKKIIFTKCKKAKKLSKKMSLSKSSNQYYKSITKIID